MIIRPLEWRSVLHVALYARACDVREIDACMGAYDAAELTGRVMAFARFGAVAATDEGHGEDTPAAVLSAAELHPGVYQVGMFATDDWPRVALGVTRWALRTMKPALLAAGAHRMECRSIATHHEAHRWLEALGAVRECALPDCGKQRETFYQYAWRLSDEESVSSSRHGPMSCAARIRVTSGHLWPIHKDGPNNRAMTDQ